MQKVNEQRIALEPSVTTDNVDTASRDLNWTFIGSLKKDEKSFRQDVYDTSYANTKVHLVHDEIMGLRYFIIRGADAGKVAAEIPQHLPVVTAAAAEQKFKQALHGPDKVTALYLWAIPNSINHTVSEIFNEALKSHDLNLQKGAIVTLGYIGGKKAQSLVKEVAKNGPSTEIREYATSMLETMKQYPEWS